MKKALIFIGLGLACCSAAILYARYLPVIGNQAVFLSIYMSGVVLTASSSAVLAAHILKKHPKVVTVSSAIASFAVTVVLLLSPFYMLS